MNQEILDYIESIDSKFKEGYKKLLELIMTNIPDGFELQMQYNMPSFVVPFNLFPQGYHCEPALPLPFLSLGVTKHHIGVYHMGIYANPKLLKWFENEYQKIVPTKLDMGKSCIRLKNVKNIPYDLMGELAASMTPEQWIELYQNNIGR